MTVRNLNISRANKTAKVCFGEAFYKPGGACGWRVQPEYQIVVIHRGEMTVFLEEAPGFLVKSGQCVLLLPGVKELLLFSPSSETHHTWLSVSPDFLMKPINVATVRTTPATIDGVIRIALSESNESVTEALGLSVFASYLSPEKAPQKPSIQKAIQFISDHLNEKISVLEIAEASFTSPQHLNRLFKSELGVTPASYLWSERTHRGIELLRSTGLSVQEIAIQLGYSSPFHFSRMVKDKTGLSPRALRNQYWDS